MTVVFITLIFDKSMIVVDREFNKSCYKNTQLSIMDMDIFIIFFMFNTRATLWAHKNYTKILHIKNNVSISLLCGPHS